MIPAPSSRSALTSPLVQDFDLHGVVGVRVVDGTPHDIATVRRQLGPIDATLDREPDITIRFVDSATSLPMTLVGVGESGFNDDGFFLLQGKGGVRARVCLPFDRFGGQVEIVCERRMPAVPHLLAVINLTALTKGVLPLHATAFTTGEGAESTGVLVAGWSKGGKTETLLACMSEGARYVGDEWVFLSPDGTMHGLPEPIRLWSWQLEQLPALLGARPARDRRRLAAWKNIARVADRTARSGLPGAGIVRRAAPVLGRQAYLQVPPADLFGPDSIALHGELDAVVLVVSHDAPETVAEPVRHGEIARRMRASLEEERAPLMTHYRHFLYAFPDRANPIVENAGELEAKLLSSLLDDRPAAKVAHPHPCDIALLGRTVLTAARDAIDRAGASAGDAPTSEDLP